MNGRTLLGFDYGERRIGVALGNTLTRSARPLAVIRNTDTASRFSSVARLLAEWQPDALVVGVPFHPDGAEHALTKLCRRFGNQLNGRFSLPVHWVDERYSSAAAAATLAEMATEGIDGQIDAEAACVILQQYLDETGCEDDKPVARAASQHSCHD